jgi:hypothetical protein
MRHKYGALCPLLALSGHERVRCTLMTQSGHNEPLCLLIGCCGRLMSAVGALKGQQFSIDFGLLLSTH